MIDNYEDIINMEHHISKVHPRLSVAQRSAQFAPFAALTGYSDEVKEKARFTNKKIELDDESLFKLNMTLQEINSCIKERPKVLITYFVKDKTKDGGKYEIIEDSVKRIDDVYQIIYLIKFKINISDILAIELIKE
jgi:hypothetical protein